MRVRNVVVVCEIMKLVIFRLAKTIIDAILGLSFDDSSSNLAAATLFYVLTSDVSCYAFYTMLHISGFLYSCVLQWIIKCSILVTCSAVGV